MNVIVVIVVVGSRGIVGVQWTWSKYFPWSAEEKLFFSSGGEAKKVGVVVCRVALDCPRSTLRRDGMYVEWRGFGVDDESQGIVTLLDAR